MGKGLPWANSRSQSLMGSRVPHLRQSAGPQLMSRGGMRPAFLLVVCVVAFGKILSELYFLRAQGDRSAQPSFCFACKSPRAHLEPCTAFISGFLSPPRPAPGDRCHGLLHVPEVRSWCVAGAPSRQWGCDEGQRESPGSGPVCQTVKAACSVLGVEFENRAVGEYWALR